MSRIACFQCRRLCRSTVGFHHLGEVDTQSEADNGDQVFECAAEISGSQVHAQPGHIAGLTIGKDMIFVPHRSRFQRIRR